MNETKNGTAIFEFTGIKLVDDFIKKFCRNFTHPVHFGATPFGTPDLKKQVKPIIQTSNLIFDVKRNSFKMNIAELHSKDNMLGSVRNEKPKGYIHVMKIWGGYQVGVFEYFGDTGYFKTYIKNLQPAK